MSSLLSWIPGFSALVLAAVAGGVVMTDNDTGDKKIPAGDKKPNGESKPPADKKLVDQQTKLGDLEQMERYLYQIKSNFGVYQSLGDRATGTQYADIPKNFNAAEDLIKRIRASNIDLVPQAALIFKEIKSVFDEAEKLREENIEKKKQRPPRPDQGRGRGRGGRGGRGNPGRGFGEPAEQKAVPGAPAV